MAVVIFPAATGSMSLPLQTRGHHWLAFPLRDVMAAPSLMLGVRCQHQLLGQAPRERKRAHLYSNHSLDVFTLCYKTIKKPGKSVKDETRHTLSSTACWIEVFCCVYLSSNWIYLCNLNIFNIIFVSAIEIFLCPCSLQLHSPFLFVT